MGLVVVVIVVAVVAGLSDIAMTATLIKDMNAEREHAADHVIMKDLKTQPIM